MEGNSSSNAGAGSGNGSVASDTDSPSSAAAAARSGSADRLDRYSGDSNNKGQNVQEMRRRILELERELKLERLSSSRRGSYRSGGRASSTGSTGSGSGYGNQSGRGGRSATPPPTRPSGVWSPATSGSRLPARQSTRSPASNAYQSRGSGSASARRDPYNNPSAKENRLKAAAAAARIRDRNTSGASFTSRSSRGSRETSPISSQYAQRPSSAPVRSRSVSPSLPNSSSRGGRFDPTAYQRAKQEKAQMSLASRERSMGGGSPGSGRYSRSSYSGYDSTDSRGSTERATSRSSSARKTTPRQSPAADKPSSASRSKAAARKKRASPSSSGQGQSASSSGALSRGILSGSDSEDDPIRMKRTPVTTRTKAATASSASASKGAGSRRGIAEKVIGASGAFPFPSMDGDDGHREDDHAPRINPSKEGPSQTRRSPKRQAPISEPESTLSPRQSFEKKTRDETMAQVLPSSPTSYRHVNSSGYGSLDGYVDAEKSEKASGSPKKSPKNSPGRSPNHTPRSSKEGLSVSFAGGSEFKKTPGGEDEIQEIDKRIQKLQSYLDNARQGLLQASNR